MSPAHSLFFWVKNEDYLDFWSREALRRVVKDYPIVVKVKALDVKTMGEKRFSFKDTN
jgi:hypothetical protein